MPGDPHRYPEDTEHLLGMEQRLAELRARREREERIREAASEPCSCRSHLHVCDRCDRVRRAILGTIPGTDDEAREALERRGRDG